MKLTRNDLDWIINLATLIVVIIGLVLAGQEVRQLRKAQEAQTLVELFSTIRSPDYIEATTILQRLPRGATAEELRAMLTDEEWNKILQMRLTFEGVGVMVYRRDISIEWVDEMFRTNLLLYWDIFEPNIMRLRQEYNPGIGEWHQWLVERIRERGDPEPAYEAYRGWKE